eukprot:14439657-Ditylum_brightwellii.AAC.1
MAINVSLSSIGLIFKKSSPDILSTFAFMLYTSARKTDGSEYCDGSSFPKRATMSTPMFTASFSLSSEFSVFMSMQ